MRRDGLVARRQLSILQHLPPPTVRTLEGGVRSTFALFVADILRGLLTEYGHMHTWYDTWYGVRSTASHSQTLKPPNHPNKPLTSLYSRVNCGHFP